MRSKFLLGLWLLLGSYGARGQEVDTKAYKQELDKGRARKAPTENLFIETAGTIPQQIRKVKLKVFCSGVPFGPSFCFLGSKHWSQSYSLNSDNKLMPGFIYTDWKYKHRPDVSLTDTAYPPTTGAVDEIVLRKLLENIKSRNLSFNIYNSYTDHRDTFNLRNAKHLGKYTIYIDHYTSYDAHLRFIGGVDSLDVFFNVTGSLPAVGRGDYNTLVGDIDYIMKWLYIYQLERLIPIDPIRCLDRPLYPILKDRNYNEMISNWLLRK